MAFKVQLIKTASAVTGSIAKIYACGDDATDSEGDVTILCTVDNISFGLFSAGNDANGNPNSKITSTISDNFIMTNGSYLEGPIVSFKSADTTGRFLVYYNV